MLDGQRYAPVPEPVPAPESLQFLWPCFKSCETSTHGVKMLTYIFKISCWKPKAQTVPSWARKLKTWKKALKNQQIITKTYKRQKYKIRMILYLFFCAKHFSFHIYFQWQCNIFQCFIVQWLFSDFSHQISAIRCFALKNLCLRLSKVPAVLCPLLSGCIVSKSFFRSFPLND